MATRPPTPYLRASDADREAAVERLRGAVLEGRIDPDELEDRLAAAYAARWTGDLERLTADITPPQPAPAPMPVAYPAQPPVRTNGMAISSLIAGLLWMWWVGSFAAIVFGHIALVQIKRSNGTQSGRAAAITGLVIGYLSVVGLLLYSVRLY